MPRDDEMERLAAMVELVLATTGAYGGEAADASRTPEQQAAARERLVAIHNLKLQGLKSIFYEKDGNIVNITSSHNVKPAAAFPVPPPLGRCTPIAARELQLGVTHRGRVLRGRLLVEPQLMTAMATVLEDQEGDAVVLFVYNMLPAEAKGMRGLQAAARLLPPGQAVAVIEPFFKRMADGSLGVRVDNPAEIVFLESLLPRDAMSLQADGGRHYRDAHYGPAADCYSRALLHMPDAEGSGTLLLVSVLLNLSATHLKLGQAPQALQCAATASAVQPSSAKAHYRTALALASMGAALAARCSMHQAFAFMPGGGPDVGEQRRMLAELEMQPQRQQQQRAPSLAAPTPREAEDGLAGLLRALAGCSLHDVAAAAAREGPTAAASAEAGTVDSAAAASASGGGMAAADATKGLGNDAFNSGRYEEALLHYRTAARALLLELPAAALLANLAACHLHLSAPQQALLAATAAAVLQPSNAKAHNRCASALLQLGWLAEAEAACASGLAAAGLDEAAETELRMLRLRITSSRRAAPASAGSGGSAATSAGRTASDGRRASYLTEREIAASRPAGTPVEGTAALNRLMGLARLDPGVARRMERLRREDPFKWRAMQEDERAAPLHEEFGRAGRLPPESDAGQCGRLLWDAYELSRGMARHLIDMACTESMPMAEIVLKRLGGHWEGAGQQERVRWLATAPDGAVSFKSSRSGCYNPTIFHSFSNAHAATVPMPPGSGRNSSRPPRTHVAVGFVDLGTLAAAVGLPEWDEHVKAAVREAVAAAAATGAGGAAAAEAKQGTQGGACPPAPPRALLLRWVGYEASPYSVAKALVLERMLRAGHLAADEVLQVWFSAAWTRATLASFRRALTELLRQHTASSKGRSAAAGGAGPGGVLPDAVLPYLQCWQLRDVGLAESRRRWLADRTKTLTCAGQFTQEADRMALCEYLLTGQLPGLGRGEVGSVLMFATPEGGPERSLDESFLEAFPPHELLAARVRASASGGGGGGRAAAVSAQADVVLAGVALLRRRVRRLASLLASGRVEVQLKLCAVEPGDPATAAAVSGLCPETISWSNIPDYLPPAEFHSLARACSAPSRPGGPATVHHMHSMNWVYEVKGASHLDPLLPYMLAEEAGARRAHGGRQGSGAREEPEYKPPKELCQRVLSLVDAGERAVSEYLGSVDCSSGAGGAGRDGGSGTAAALVYGRPTVENPRNVADYGLTLAHYQAWVSAFFAAGGLQQSPLRHAVVTAKPAYGPLSRSNTTISLALTYGGGPLAL